MSFLLRPITAVIMLIDNRAIYVDSKLQILTISKEAIAV
ncbi:MAG: hypothetical protein ACJAVX_000624 [Pseudoalteromonas rhizosphaerae]|mgnify:CR=1 FL=1|jgi:hypothetical protein